MADTHAWILTLAPDFRVAVADREMIEFIVDPFREVVPMTPEHCREVLVHRDELLPLYNLNTLLGREPLPHNRYVGMLAFQDAPRQPLKHLAVYLYGPPARVAVKDEWVTEVPEYYRGALADLALSCFTLGELAVPILNVPYLGSPELVQRLLQENHEAAGQVVSPEAAG